jgi:DNA-binding winged helix-turn-helix (wHTH) protein
LRKLIEADPSSPRYIQTVWGFGYVFVPDEASDAASTSDKVGT